MKKILNVSWERNIRVQTNFTFSALQVLDSYCKSVNKPRSRVIVEVVCRFLMMSEKQQKKFMGDFEIKKSYRPKINSATWH